MSNTQSAPSRYLLIDKTCQYNGNAVSSRSALIAVRGADDTKGLIQVLGNMPLTGRPFKERPPNSAVIDCQLKGTWVLPAMVFNPDNLESIGFLPNAADPRVKITKSKAYTRD